MSDDDWLRAITKYSGEFPAHSSLPDLKGGAPQLAQALAARIDEEPDRFARLSLRFPSDANPVYLAQTLSALKHVSVDADLKLKICRKAFDEAFGECGREIADLLETIEDPLPDDAIEMLHSLMIDHDDPAAELWQTYDPRDGIYHQENISDFGLNSTRGRGCGHDHSSHTQGRRLHGSISPDTRADGARPEPRRPFLGRGNGSSRRFP